VFLGTARGVTLIGPTSRETFAVAQHELPRLDAVMGVVTRKLDTLRAVSDAERRATEAAAAASRRPIYHLVQPGEALDVIARRYGVTVDSLLVWNSLPDTRIRIGSRLLVRQGR
jgi:LysM repeat protein